VFVENSCQKYVDILDAIFVIMCNEILGYLFVVQVAMSSSKYDTSRVAVSTYARPSLRSPHFISSRYGQDVSS
jgi:hypothetical protein